MDMEHQATPANAWHIFDSPTKLRDITWAPKRQRSKSMFTRVPKRNATKPRRLCFSEAFEDDGTNEILATPIENAINEFASLDLNQSPTSSRDRAHTEWTPSELDQKLERLHKNRARGKNSQRSSDQDFRMTRASRRIKLDDVVEQKLKSMCKNVR